MVRAQQSAEVFRLTLDGIAKAFKKPSPILAAREEPLSCIATAGEVVDSTLVLQTQLPRHRNLSPSHQILRMKV